MRASAAAIAFCLLVAAAGTAPAQDVPRDVREGSRNLDVPYEATPPAVVEAMLGLAGLTAKDFIVDLGSGDGRVVIAAARGHGARGFGVDLNEELVAIANARARRAGVADRTRFYVRDIFAADIRRASVVTAYLSPDVMLRLRPKLLDSLAPGARVVSHQHHMGDWRPDATRILTTRAGRDSVVYLWVVPAEIGGYWNWQIDHPRLSEEPLRYVGKITQNYQDFDGEVELGLQPMPIREAAVRGRRVAFSVTGEIASRIVRQEFEGRLEGNEIVGTARFSGGVREIVLQWRAWRAPAIFR